MKIILIQVLLPLTTYAIGILIGIRIGMKYAYRRVMMIIQKEAESDKDSWDYEALCDLVDPEDLQHVGYSEAECGYDK